MKYKNRMLWLSLIAFLVIVTVVLVKIIQHKGESHTVASGREMEASIDNGKDEDDIDSSSEGDLEDGLDDYNGPYPELCGDPVDEFDGCFEGGLYRMYKYGAVMHKCAIRIELSTDSGNTWYEISTPWSLEEHNVVPSGVGFSTEKIGFISYDYYEDAGPDIWRTSDGGVTWQELKVALPEEYNNDKGNNSEYRFVYTPGSPQFDGSNGIYPIEVRDRVLNKSVIVYMYSDDYGMTWEFK